MLALRVFQFLAPSTATYSCVIINMLIIINLIVVPGRDACEVTMVHQEDAGMNVEMAKLAFAKGIWSYVCKMNKALRDYSSGSRSRSSSVATMLRIIKKVSSHSCHSISSKRTLRIVKTLNSHVNWLN